ncbi:hypothetical protein B0J18DRAFT_478492 [Chaetomium sp. MPI-SDFR-AT-0129]|nr:hypothetical protein B0J18DRAFT_478492 [Chaetomium sp. MPI-SDFR-AT-0129]
MSQSDPSKPVDSHGIPFPPGRSPFMGLPQNIILLIAQELDNMDRSRSLFSRPSVSTLCQTAPALRAITARVIYNEADLLPTYDETCPHEFLITDCLRASSRLLRTARSTPELARLVLHLKIGPPGPINAMDSVPDDLVTMVRDIVRRMFKVHVLDHGRISATIVLMALVMSLPNLTSLFIITSEKWLSTSFLTKPGAPEPPVNLLHMRGLNIIPDDRLGETDVGVRLQLFNGLLHRLPALERLNVLLPRNGETLTARFPNLKTLYLKRGHLSYKALRVLLRDCALLQRVMITHDVYSTLRDTFMPVSPAQILECLDRAACRDTLEKLTIHTWLPPAPIPAPENPYYPRHDDNNNADADADAADDDDDDVMLDIDGNPVHPDDDGMIIDSDSNSDDGSLHSISTLSSLVSSIHSDDGENSHLKVRPYPARPVPAGEFGFLGEYRRSLAEVGPALRAVSLDYNAFGWVSGAGNGSNGNSGESRITIARMLDGLGNLETVSLFNVLLEDRLMWDLAEFIEQLPYNGWPRLREVVIQTPRNIEPNERWRRYWRPAKNWTVAWNGMSADKWQAEGRSVYRFTVGGRVRFKLYAGRFETDHWPDVEYGGL